MAKGLCCQVQADGHLGDPIQITVKHKDGTTSQRCGVCEVRPSCSNPQKKVFGFRFLKAAICGLASTGGCTPTPAGIAQYSRVRTQVMASGATLEVQDPFFAPGEVPTYVTLPIPGAGAPRRIPYTLPSP